MKLNNITEFKSFINDLDLVKSNHDKTCLYDMFIKKDETFYILDIEKRKVIQTSQTFSLDSEWISHIEEFIFYELYIEHMEQYAVNSPIIDTIALTFRTLKDLKKVEQFIKDNFKFLKK